MVSARLTAVAVTSITTSPGPAVGSGSSARTRASGPPGSGAMTARMRLSLGADRAHPTLTPGSLQAHSRVARRSRAAHSGLTRGSLDVHELLVETLRLLEVLRVVGVPVTATPLLGQLGRGRGQPFELLGVGLLQTRGVAEEIGGDRCRRTLDVVGRVPGEVEDQSLVDFCVDLERVAELVNPVVQGHCSSLVLRHRSGNRKRQMAAPA